MLTCATPRLARWRRFLVPISGIKWSASPRVTRSGTQAIRTFIPFGRRPRLGFRNIRPGFDRCPGSAVVTATDRQSPIGAERPGTMELSHWQPRQLPTNNSPVVPPPNLPATTAHSPQALATRCSHEAVAYPRRVTTHDDRLGSPVRPLVERFASLAPVGAQPFAPAGRSAVGPSPQPPNRQRAIPPALPGDAWVTGQRVLYLTDGRPRGPRNRRCPRRSRRGPVVRRQPDEPDSTNPIPSPALRLAALVNSFTILRCPAETFPTRSRFALEDYE